MTGILANLLTLRNASGPAWPNKTFAEGFAVFGGVLIVSIRCLGRFRILVLFCTLFAYTQNQ